MTSKGPFQSKAFYDSVTRNAQAMTFKHAVVE